MSVTGLMYKPEKKRSQKCLFFLNKILILFGEIGNLLIWVYGILKSLENKMSISASNIDQINLKR